MNLARLLLPALRWDPEHGFRTQRDLIARSLDLGVGGFIVFGGEAGSVRDLTDELHTRSGHPLLIGSDLERGAGQQFRGATPLPPAAAIGSLGEPAITRHGAEITARDAAALGINWIYAPVADVDLEPDNPIIGTRAFGTDPDEVARHVSAWIEGCTAGGALACAKHFPGHGRTTGDSHAERPCVDADRTALEQDLLPFRAAARAGVGAMMTAHVRYPAFDGGEAPATLSRAILHDLLRQEIGFTGLIVTDALIMEGLVEGIDERRAAVLAVAAGCDALLYPRDLDAVVSELESAQADGRLAAYRLQEAVGRVAHAAEAFTHPAAGEWGREEDRRWALETASRTLQIVRGEPRLPPGAIRLIEVEDDAGGPYPPYPRTALPAALRSAGSELSEQGAPVVALYSDIRAWKGRPGLSTSARERVREVIASDPSATLLLFSHPRIAAEIPTAPHVLACWGGEALMQEAAAAWLTGRDAGLPSLSAGLDR